MRRRVPSAVKTLIALTAAGLLLSGCHAYHRAHHGKPYYAAPAYGHHQHRPHGKGKKHHHRPPPYHHGQRGYR